VHLISIFSTHFSSSCFFAASRCKLSLLRRITRAWMDAADEIKNRPQLAEADMWYSRRLLRGALSAWFQHRVTVRSKFAEANRTKGLFSALLLNHELTPASPAVATLAPAVHSRLEAALQREVQLQLQLDHSAQVAVLHI
jgi:hypothetical protein